MKNIIKNKEVAQNVKSRLFSFLDRRNGQWEGTMTELMAALTKNRQIDLFPGSTSSLRLVLNRLTRTLRKEGGYKVSFTRTTDSKRSRMINFSRVNSQ